MGDGGVTATMTHTRRRVSPTVYVHTHCWLSLELPLASSQFVTSWEQRWTHIDRLSEAPPRYEHNGATRSTNIPTPQPSWDLPASKPKTRIFKANPMSWPSTILITKPRLISTMCMYDEIRHHSFLFELDLLHILTTLHLHCWA